MTTERWIKDNLEAIAIAVVMALVIRQFAVEAFKIPTESMAPTLYGERRGLPGDRLLVDKIGPLVGGLSRFDIIVFKYPLNESKNFIKRLVGLPGETLTIRDGDIFIDDRIARKPPHVQDVLFFPVCPVEGEAEKDALLRWSLPEEGFRREGETTFVGRAGEEAALVLYRRPVKDVAPWAGEADGHSTVGDVRLAVSVTPRSDRGEVLLRAVENRVVNEVVLAVGEGASFLRHGEERLDLPGVVLAPGRATEVVFSNVDDALYVDVGGDRFRYEYEGTRSPDHAGDAVGFGVRAGEAGFASVRLLRDIYYEQKQTSQNVKIPEGHYFMLGDNSRRSKDSRVWELRTKEMKDGTRHRVDESEADSRTRAGAEPGTVEFVDHLGLFRRVAEADIVREVTEPAPFVPAENIVGRAFFVFWPLNPLKDAFRVKFIR